MEISEVEYRKQQKIGETKSQFFEKINTIDKPFTYHPLPAQGERIYKFPKSGMKVGASQFTLQKFKKDLNFMPQIRHLKMNEKILRKLQIQKRNKRLKKIENLKKPITSKICSPYVKR